MVTQAYLPVKCRGESCSALVCINVQAWKSQTTNLPKFPSSPPGEDVGGGMSWIPPLKVSLCSNEIIFKTLTSALRTAIGDSVAGFGL